MQLDFVGYEPFMEQPFPSALLGSRVSDSQDFWVLVQWCSFHVLVGALLPSQELSTGHCVVWHHLWKCARGTE